MYNTWKTIMYAQQVLMCPESFKKKKLQLKS